MLHDLGMKDGSAYFYNGLMMVASFTLARIIPLPIYLYCLISIMDTEDYINSGMGKILVWMSTLVLDSLNLLWYKKMILGAIKVWNKRKTSLHEQDIVRVKDIKQG